MIPTPSFLLETAPVIGQFGWDGIATIIAAVLATTVAVWGYAFQQRMARRERRAAIYSEALRAVEDYLEAPYLVRRRDGSAASRQAITTHISDIQSRLAYHRALLEIHAHSEISTAYDALVSAARAEAGKAMREAWEAKPPKRDKEVSIPSRIDRSRSDEARRTYVDAIKRHDA